MAMPLRLRSSTEAWAVAGRNPSSLRPAGRRSAVQTVDVLRGIDGIDHPTERDVFGQGHLDDDPVDRRIVVQGLICCRSSSVEQPSASSTTRPAAPTFSHDLRMLLQIDRRRRITADEDDDQRRCAAVRR
jgi:hypothetical protein